jgi:hypothetical protein
MIKRQFDNPLKKHNSILKLRRLEIIGSLDEYIIEFKILSDVVEMTNDTKCIYFRDRLCNWLKEKLNFFVEINFEDLLQKTILVNEVSNTQRINSIPQKTKRPTDSNSASDKPKYKCTICKKDNHTDDRCFHNPNNKRLNNNKTDSQTAKVMSLEENFQTTANETKCFGATIEDIDDFEDSIQHRLASSSHIMNSQIEEDTERP